VVRNGFTFLEGCTLDVYVGDKNIKICGWNFYIYYAGVAEFHILGGGKEKILLLPL
jgi:hypothetical protein